MSTASKKQTLTLVEITEEIEALESLVDPETGEWTDTHEELRIEVMGKLACKADSFGAFLRDQEARSQVLADEIDRLSARKRAFDRRVASMKTYGMYAMQRMERPKIEGTYFTLALQNNPERVELAAGVALPDQYVRVIPESRQPDKAAILAALKAGETIEGAELVRSQHLRVR